MSERAGSGPSILDAIGNTSIAQLQRVVPRNGATILTKLEWSKFSGGSERQRRDVRGILDLKGADLDRAYIDRWAHDLKLEEEWAVALQPDP